METFVGQLDSKVALITGAANGIGLAIVRRFLAEGASVFLVDVDKQALADAAISLGPKANCAHADVSQVDDARNYVEQAIKAFGRIDIAVLNAGIEGRVAPIVATPIETFDKVMAVNVRGVWLGLTFLLPAMKTSGGSIIVTSSVAGLRGRAGMAPYAASKHAVIGLAKTAALEGARDGIRVNAICPGPSETRMMTSIDAGAPSGDATAARNSGIAGIPLKRYATPMEIANLALFLASDEASFVTGATYLIDGGNMAGRAD